MPQTVTTVIDYPGLPKGSILTLKGPNYVSANGKFWIEASHVERVTKTPSNNSIK